MEQPTGEAKPESEPMGSEKVEADGGAKPEKSALPTEAMAEGTVDSCEKLTELDV